MAFKFIQNWKERIKMWDDYYDDYLNMYSPERALSLNRWMYMDSNFTYSGLEKVTAYYVIESLPEIMMLGYRSTLRRGVPEGISMNFFEVAYPFEIDWNDPAFKSRMLILESVQNDQQEERANETVYSSHKSKSDRDKEERIAKSIEYVQTATLSSQNQRRLMKVRIMVVITGARGQEFSDCLQDFEKRANAITGMSIKRVTGKLSTLIRAFSPFTPIDTSSKEYRNFLTSDELKARWHSFEQGVVGYGNVYLGTNIDTNSPVFKTFKRDATDAEILLILGMTGSGKSFLMKNLNIQLSAFDNMIMTINDYEGGEYNTLGILVGNREPVVQLDFSLGSGRYFDPVPLSPTGDASIDNNLLDTAKENCVNIFRAVAGDETLSKHDWISIIIDKGVNEFYRQLGVTSDTSTWYKTQGKSIYDIYKIMVGYRPRTDGDDARFDADKTYFLEKFGEYFDEDLKNNNYFTHPVSLGEIVNAKLVICNYNMRGRTEDNLSELDSLLIPLNASIISYYRTIFPYAQGKYNIKVWEELQRFKKLRNAVSLLKTPLSGGRKMGDINIVGSNDPAELIKEDDFNLFGSYNVALVGKIPSPEVREDVCRKLGLMDMLDELNQIGDIVEEDDGIDVSYDDVQTNPYRKAFVAKLDTNESVVLKVDLPKWLSETDLFRTGVKEKDKEE